MELVRKETSAQAIGCSEFPDPSSPGTKVVPAQDVRRLRI